MHDRPTIRQVRTQPGTAQDGDADVRRTLGLDPGRRTGRIIRKIVVTLLILGAIAALALWVGRKMRGTPPEYETAEVTRGDLRVTVTATGTLQGLNTVEVGSEISGRLAKVEVDYNDPVTKGQLLAEIDTEQLTASVEEARAQLAAARASIKQAKATAKETKLAAERASAQSKQGLIPRAQLESARAAAERAKASVSSAVANAALAQAALASAQSRLDKASIVSPIDGIVLARLVEPGQTVVAGLQTPVLFKLAEDLTKMRLYVDVDEADVGKVHEGLSATFTVDAFPERTFESSVIELRNDPKVSQNVVTYEAVLAADNPERLLRPGMTATAVIVTETLEGVVLVPNAALRFTPPMSKGPPGRRGPKPPPASAAEAGSRLYTLEAGKPVPKQVHSGATDGQRTVVRDGDIEPGTEVVVGTVERE